jgi:hypothetical protein
MGIKRQKASAIMQSLLIDLAATGSFEALAIIKKAWTIQSAATNTQNALVYLKSAAENAASVLGSIDKAVNEGPINASWKPRVIEMAESTGKMISDIEQSVALISSTPSYWSTTGRDLLLDISSRLKQLIASFSALHKELASGRDMRGGKNDIYHYLWTSIDSLTDALDEIENAMDAADIDPSAAPAAAPSAAPSGASAVEPDKAYMDYIFGAHKLLDKFLEEYASGELTPVQDAIIKRLIMDNADSKKLMSAYLKKDNQPELNKMIKDPNFSSKAKVLFDRIKVNITTATTELDKLGQL